MERAQGPTLQPPVISDRRPLAPQIPQHRGAARARTRQGTSLPAKPCLLFSGGLDSFAGALDILSQTSDHVAFVGHYGSGSTHGEQKRVYEMIDAVYPNRTTPFWFFVQ